jgi:hypothetical protein
MRLQKPHRRTLPKRDFRQPKTALSLPNLTRPEPLNPPDHQRPGLRAKPDAQILKSYCPLPAFVNSPCPPIGLPNQNLLSVPIRALFLT